MFYISGNKFEKKPCDFFIFAKLGGEKKQIASLANYNMANFCN